MFLSPTSNQTQPCVTFFYTGIAVTSNVSSILVDCGHNDWAWDSWYLTATTKANNYAAVTTPLQPPSATFPQNLGTPGGRDFAASWTDKQGRKWLFGGLGFPYLSPLGPQLPSYLNDLWVYDPFVAPAGGWIPANLPIYVNGTGATATAEVRLDPLIGAEGNVPTGSAPGSRWGSSSWTDPTSGNLYLFGGQGVDVPPVGPPGIALLNDSMEVHAWRCRLMSMVPAPALVHGLSLEAQPLAARAASTALREYREAFREADGLPQRLPETSSEIFGFSVGKAWTRRAQQDC